MFESDPLYFTKQVLSSYVSKFKTRLKSFLMYFLWSILGKILGFSVFLVLDTLTSISCHLRAIGSRLNARFQLQEH